MLVFLMQLLKMMKKITLIEYPNALGLGIKFTMVYNPLFDGDIKDYKNRKDCTVKEVEIEDGTTDTNKQ